MKNIILFLLSFTSVLAVTNTTTDVVSLKNYGADFTDTDGDGMTDVAELKYGFDPNDSNSFPTKDYTFLYEDGTPTLHESSGVTDPLNEIRFMFTESEWLLNRKGESNLETLKNNREFLNLMMPILLEELGPPPESFTVKISCLNRGVYANGTRISVNDDTAPGSYIHEIGHVWKYGWVYSFMKLRGSKRGNFRGFEEGFSEALKYNVCNKFVEAYPNHPYVTKYFTTGRNAETWRGGVYDFDVTLGNPTFSGGTFWSGRYTQYRYENSSGIFSVLANQREGAMRDLLRVFYENAENNPDWDWTNDSQDIFNLWESVLPEVNGIDTSDWLTQTKLLDGKPVSQRLYVTIIDGCAYFMYPDSQGNFSWKHDALFVANVPSWFPTKEVNGKWMPDVSNIPFNLEVRTINGEIARESQRTTSTKDLAETYMSEIHTDALPIGLYKATVNFPTYEQHSEHTSGTSYVIGTQHTLHSNDELNIHVGVDIPSATRVRMSINDDLYESELINGLSVFRFNDIGIDYTGAIEILIFDGNTERTYKRAVSHFGTRSGTRLNEFVIADRDFDGVEDAFDSSVLTILPMNYVKFSEIEETAHLIANPKTEKINLLNVITTFSEPPVVIDPFILPTNPITTLESKITTLEQNVVELTTENANLSATLESSQSDVNTLESTILTKNSEIDSLSTELVNSKITIGNLLDKNSRLTSSVNTLESSVSELKVSLAEKNQDNTDISSQLISTKEDVESLTLLVNENNKTIESLTDIVDEFNSTILDLSTRLSLEQNSTIELTTAKTRLETENDELKQKIKDLQEELVGAETSNSVLATNNSTLQSDVSILTTNNFDLMSSLDSAKLEVTKLTSELTEAIRVANVPFTSGWFYDPEDGWLYTDANMFPLVYKHSNKTWYFYELGSHDSRYFYSYETHQWEEWK